MNMKKMRNFLTTFALSCSINVIAQSSWTTIIPRVWDQFSYKHDNMENPDFWRYDYKNGKNPFTGNVTIPPYVIEKAEGDDYGGIKMITSISGGYHPGWIVKARTRSGYSEVFGGGDGAPSLNSNQYGMFYQADIDTLRLPHTIKQIWGLAFEEAKVNVLICAATTPPILGTGNEGIATTCKLIVPTGSLNAYKEAESWNKFTTIEEGAEDFLPAQMVKQDGAWFEIRNNVGMLVNSDDAYKLVIPDDVEFIGKKYPVTLLGPASVNRYRVVSLTLGKNVTNFNQSNIQTTHFHEEGTSGMYDYDYNTVTLKEIHVSPDNLVYSEVNGALYSKDGKALLFLPYVNTISSSSARYYTIPYGVTTIMANAFPRYTEDNYYDRQVDAGGIIVPPSVTKIESQDTKRGFYMIMTAENPPVMTDDGFNGTIYVPNGCLYNYLDVSPYNNMTIKEYPKTGVFSLEPNFVPLLTSQFTAYWDVISQSYDISGMKMDIDATSLEFPSEILYGSMSGPVKSIGKNRAVDVRDDARTIIVPEGVEYLRLGGYSNTRTVILPSTLREIGDYCFSNCKYLTDIVLPDDVTKINEYAFQGCAFETITLPRNMNTLCEYVFYKCERLKEVTIPANLKRLGASAFSDCKSLKDIYIESANPPELFNSLSEQGYYINWQFHNLNIPASTILHVPVGSKVNFESSPVWGGFAQIIEDMPANSTGINNVFADIQTNKIFNIAGQRITSKKLISLPKGVYILNGKKIIRK